MVMRTNKELLNLAKKGGHAVEFRGGYSRSPHYQT